jgi:preprotein translocase subunit YajC
MAAILPLILLAMALYFLVLPQRRRAQAQRSVAASLKPGDRIVTAGGMIGTLEYLDGERARVRLGPDVEIEFLAAAIVRRLDEPPEEPLHPPVEEDRPEPVADRLQEPVPAPVDEQVAEPEAAAREPQPHEATASDDTSEES